jgi:hypothetical protein
VPSNVTLAQRFKAVVNAIKRIYDDQWPGRRIRFSGDTTRAPSQGPSPNKGGRMPPCIERSGLVLTR